MQPKVQQLACEVCKILLNMKGSPYSKRLETIVLENFFHKSVWVNLTTRWWYETTNCKKGNSNTHKLFRKKFTQFTFLAIWQKTLSMIKCSLISMITFVQAFQLVE